MVQTVNKWGHSLGIRIPSQLAKNKNITEGTQVEILETQDGILLKARSKNLTMEELLDSIPDDYVPENLLPNTLPSEEW